MTPSAASKVDNYFKLKIKTITKPNPGRYHHEERMVSDLRSRNSRYEETEISGNAGNQLDDQVKSET